MGIKIKVKLNKHYLFMNRRTLFRGVFVFFLLFLQSCSLSYRSQLEIPLTVKIADKKVSDNDLTKEKINQLNFSDFDKSEKIQYIDSHNNTVFKISFNSESNRAKSLIVLPHHFYSVGLLSNDLVDKNWVTRNEYVQRREYSTNLIAFDLKPGQSVFYVAVKNQLARKIDFVIDHQVELKHYDRRVSTFFTSVYSILLTLVFVNFVFFIFIRKISYLYYSLYIFSALAAIFTQEGAIANMEFLSIPFFGDYTAIVFAKIAFPLFWVFAISFLNLNKGWNYKIAKAFLFFEIVAVVVILFISLFSLSYIYPTFIFVSNLITLLGALFAMFLSIKCAFNKNQQAVYLAIGWSVLITSVFMRTYYSMFPNPHDFWMFRFTEVALMIEALVLSAGLAHKTLRAMDQRDLAEAKFNSADRALFNQELVSSFQERSHKTIGKYFGPQKKLSSLIDSYFISTIEQIIDVNHVLVIPDRNKIDEVKLISNSDQNLDKDFFMYENSEVISKACHEKNPQVKKLRYINNKNSSDIIIPVNEEENQSCIVLSSPSYYEINDEKLHELSEFAGEITSSFIEVGKLQKIYKESKIDALTNVLNRKSIDELFDKMLLNLNRTDDTVAIAFIDIDDFKTINDDQGHSIGDDCLKLLCDQLTLIFHDFAYIGRYGGDEFVAIMSNHSQQEITSKFEDLYANLKFNYINDFTVSVSVGIAIGQRKSGKLIRKELLVSADNALYKAKKQGKNQFVFADL